MRKTSPSSGEARPKRPSRVKRQVERARAWRMARATAGDPLPFDRRAPDGTTVRPPAGFQHHAACVVEEGVTENQGRWAKYGGAIREAFAAVVEETRHVSGDIDRLTRAHGDEDPKWGLVGAAAICALVLIGIVGVATILPWTQSWKGWALPLAVLAAFALATLESCRRRDGSRRRGASRPRACG